MIHSTQRTDPPATGGSSGGRKLSTADDALLVSVLRSNAEAAGVDWRSDPLAPSVIQRTSDQLFPSDQRCGESRARRIRGLVQSLPEGIPEAGGSEAEAPEDDRRPEVPPEDVAPEVQPPTSGGSQSAEVVSQSVGASAPEDQGAGTLRKLWSRATYRRTEGAPPEADGESSGAPERAWPLLLIAASAFVGLWGGWVGLGEMTGFGVSTPLPGIVDWQINAAITLPLGIEVLAAYAIRAWLSGYGTARTRRFAKRAAAGCLVLGAAGQTAFHLLEVAGIGHNAAPWQVTAVVSVIPVASIGLASALHHMLSTDRRRFQARKKATAQDG